MPGRKRCFDCGTRLDPQESCDCFRKLKNEVALQQQEQPQSLRTQNNYTKSPENVKHGIRCAYV